VKASLLVSLSVGVIVACGRGPDATSRAPIRVAAASDLSLAFEELGRLFERETGQPVVFSFGSTGLLAKQLREGAPFDLFAAANVSFVDTVVSGGNCDGDTKAPYGRGRIAMWSRAGKRIIPTRLEDLTDERFVHIAIANPEHAPYGQAAKEAMQSVDIWERVQPRLVFGENVRQALQFAETGNAEVAIVALSLVIADIKDEKNPWTLIDESLHRPIDQALVVCNRGHDKEGGAAFARFVNSQSGRQVMRRYGFLLPGEAVAQ
jgi:molybdate transport system substrate-binding protein